jgi:predicted ribosome quality control (RQC) complex YloA/Tae2 family protein
MRTNYRNAEHYMDLTAAQAIENIMHEERRAAAQKKRRRKSRKKQNRRRTTAWYAPKP